MRASWSGYFRIGDVVLPVRLYAATKSIAPRFVQLHAADHSPVTRVTVCMQDGEELNEDEIVRAAKHGDTYVEISDSELERSGAAEKNMVVRQFSVPGAIDPIYYDKPYYLVPAKGGELAYAILRQAFTRAEKVAVVTYVFYDREHIGVVTVRGGVLMLQALRFADEIVPRGSVPSPALPQPSPAQVRVATRLMEQYSTPFYVEDYRNEQLDLLNELIDRKARGLPPRRKQQIAPHTTPENEVVERMNKLLVETPKGLL